MPYQLKSSEIQFSVFVFLSLCCVLCCGLLLLFWNSFFSVVTKLHCSDSLFLHCPDHVLHEIFSTPSAKVTFLTDIPSTRRSSNSGCFWQGWAKWFHILKMYVLKSDSEWGAIRTWGFRVELSRMYSALMLSPMDGRQTVYDRPPPESKPSINIPFSSCRESLVFISCSVMLL